MPKWQKLLGGALLIAVLLTVAWFLINKYILVEENTNININQITQPVDNTNNQTEIPITINKEEAALRALSLFFASRFGSYSTTSQFSNLREIDYLLTQRMRTWAQNYINTSLTPPGYYSVITKGISANIKSFTGSQAQILVGTQRQEMFSVGGEMQFRYQNLLLKFIKEGEEWKVDDAEWQK